MKINALNKSFQELNAAIKKAQNTTSLLEIQNAAGQRYIAAGMEKGRVVHIYGTPGNDLAAYNCGAEIEVFGNAQDQVANTMDGGKIIIHGRIGDAAGYAMRDGDIYVMNECGYRCGIHMKEYMGKSPLIVIGGGAGDFLGEYMAGGTIVLLGIGCNRTMGSMGHYCATGIHGGRLYVRGQVPGDKISKEAKVVPCTAEDLEKIAVYVKNYCEYFNGNFNKLMYEDEFVKIVPASSRPYKAVYVNN
ncbi:MAG: hypothetical protein LUG52_00475 [Clostridia bacterium]|nr:hypothetical protein [Clostridia bacterium]